MKLNNRGWGFGLMFIFIIILGMAFYLIWYGSLKINEQFNAVSNKNKYYSNLESNFVSSAKLFLNDNPINECFSIGCTINYELLLANNYIKPYVDKTTEKECGGCVKVYNDIYQAYISCDNYKTEDYKCVK